MVLGDQTRLVPALAYSGRLLNERLLTSSSHDELMGWMLAHVCWVIAAQALGTTAEAGTWLRHADATLTRVKEWYGCHSVLDRVHGLCQASAAKSTAWRRDPRASA